MVNEPSKIEVADRKKKNLKSVVERGKNTLVGKKNFWSERDGKRNGREVN